MKRYIIVKTKYAGATNIRGSRIIVSCESYIERRRTYSYDYGANDPHESAVNRFADDFLRGARPIGYDACDTGNLYIFEWIGVKNERV